MQKAIDDRLKSRLEEIIQRGAEKLDATEFVEFANFVRTLYRDVPEQDLYASPVEEYYGAALSLWKLAAKRKPGTPNIRVYNPSIEEHGWRSPHTVIELVNRDMPFLLGSLTALIVQRGLGVHFLAHPVIDVPRDAEGVRLKSEVAPAKPAKGKKTKAAKTVVAEDVCKSADGRFKAVNCESLMHVQIDRIASDATRAELEAEIEEMLEHVRRSVDDWRRLTGRIEAIAKELEETAPHEPEERAEVVEFLDWMAADHFTLLGARDYKISGSGKKRTLEPEENSGLGLMSDPGFMVLKNAAGEFVETSPEVNAFIDNPAPILIVKSNRRSVVHRRVHLDLISVKRYDKKGAVVGERRVIGLFTSVAYSRNPQNIPYLRRKVARTVARAGYTVKSHNANALEYVLAAFPRDELFQISEEDLYEISRGVLELELRPRTRLFLRHDPFDRFVSALLYVPRDRFNSALRAKVADMLVQAYDGRLSSFYPTFGDSALARVHYIIATKPGHVPEVDTAALEAKVVSASRSWVDDLRDALVELHGEAKGLSLYSRYSAAFDPSYQSYFAPATAVGDVEKIEEASLNGLSLKFYRNLEDSETTVRLKLFRRGALIPLSDCLPVLEKMGLRVHEEHPFEIALDGDPDKRLWLHDFSTVAQDGQPIDLSALRVKLEEAFQAAWSGAVEVDAFNKLVLTAGLSATEAAVIRAYARYLRQAGLALSQTYVQETLAKHSGVTAELMSLFRALLDPDADLSPEERQAKADAISATIEQALEQVSSLDEDRILRRFRNAIQSTLRTNVFRPQEVGKPPVAMAFKLDSQALDELPLPKPYREIWVYSPQVEGVHLRFGPVARGGLRWSDRREDFRTEVLGLVKAQQVKNAVIVPVGSKGGFYPKQLPVGGAREEVFEAGREAYKVFIASLLDVTDNIVGDAVSPPPSVVRRDGDDPYLVVAADKGTATFSDTANAIAEAYGFWLGDAFASGGSQGYDHKGMGITARGGWEAVKRHFREMGTDIQSEPFTVIGVGDMSGDVFGNGMLLSQQIRLLAAFDHRDIFIDPTPDEASSFVERKRLFETPRSSWQMYDPKLISKGGGVFSRASKSISLTPEIKVLTGIAKDSVTPNELLKAILKIEADLLWFGGIGTYVKSSEESHADAGDRANDAIRINAQELGVAVVGEGANLGVTQRGRIAFAQKGGRINTDAVDNSAGVDCSDHEVNIKIALGQVVEAGDMTMKQRNTLLAKMTDEVGELVLGTNYRQTLALSLEESRAVMRLDDHHRFMEALETAGLLNREVEQLPADAEIAKREGAASGLTRPELSVLLAYAKITLFDQLVAGDAPDDPALRGLLIGYMPTPLAERYTAAVESHRLRREIISTVLCNAMINEGGVTFAHRLGEESAASAGEIARCFAAAREIFHLPSLYDAVNALDSKADADAQTEMHLILRDALTTQTSRLLEDGAGKRPIAEAVARFAGPVKEIADALDNGLSEYVEASPRFRGERLIELGADPSTARRIATLPFLLGVIDTAEVAAATGRKPVEAATVWYSLGAELGLDWLRSSAEAVEAGDHWDRIALARLMADLLLAQRRMTEAALRLDTEAKKSDPASAAERWLATQGESYERFKGVIADARRTGGVSLSQLSVVIGAIGRMAL